MMYRKLPDQLHQWHHHASCPEWPESGYMEHENPEEKLICVYCDLVTKLEANSTDSQFEK